MYWDNPYWWFMVGGSVVALGVIVFVWPRRYATGAGLLMAMMLGVFFWSFGYAMEYGCRTLEARLWGLKLEYLGITSVPPLWLAFTLSYTGRSKWLTRRNVILASVLPLLTLVLAFTTEHHGLIYQRIGLLEVKPFPLLDFDRGLWFWGWVGLSYVLLALGSLILVKAIIRSPNLYRKQAAMVLLGAAIPWASNIVYLSGVTDGTNIDFTPFAFALTGLFWTWGLFRFRLMDLEPVAHQVVIEGLNEAVLVLDPMFRLVNANAAARKLTGLDREEAIGAPLHQIAPDLDRLVGTQAEADSLVAEIESGPYKEPRWYEIRISDLVNWRFRPMGKVVVLYDITSRKRTENALKASEERYRLAVENSQSGIILVDNNYTIVYTNPEFARLMGYPKDDIVGHDFREFLDQESRDLVSQRYKARQGGQSPPSRYTIRMIRRDRAVRIVELSSAVFRDTEGRIRTMAQVMDVTEREEAEAALRESEELYRTVFEQSRDVIYITRPDNEIVQFNQAAVDLLGFTLEEYRNLGLGKAYMDPAQRIRQLSLLNRNGFIKDYEIKLRRKDGSEIICLDTATAWKDESGQVKGYIGTLRDVTAGKKAEQALKESEERYQRILETSQDPMVLADMEGRVIYLNPSFTRIFGWTLEEISGRRIDFVPEEHRAETEKMYELLKRGEFFSGFETRRSTKSGRVLDISISAAVFRAREGEPRGIVVNLRDITRRKQAEDDLRESEQKFRNISSNALDGIIMIDPKGLISFWNEAAERMFGYTSEEALGQDLHLLLAPEKYHPFYLEAYHEYQATGKGGAVGKTLELSALKKGGEEFPVEISISSLRSHDSWHAIGIVRDISDRKQAEAERERLEAQLRQAQKMEAVGTLASGVAHDFNNLLQGISGYAQLIKTRDRIDEKARHYALEIEEAAQRASELVTGLLTFGRKVEPELKPVDLNGVVLQGVKFLERTIPRMVEIKTDLAPRPEPHQRRSEPAQPGSHEPGGQRPRRPARGRKAGVRNRERNPGREPGGRQPPASRRLRPAHCFGQRDGHERGGSKAHLRTLLHHQGPGQGHRPGAVHGLRHRQQPRRAHHLFQPHGRGDRIHRLFPGSGRRKSQAGDRRPQDGATARRR